MARIGNDLEIRVSTALLVREKGRLWIDRQSVYFVVLILAPRLDTNKVKTNKHPAVHPFISPVEIR